MRRLGRKGRILKWAGLVLLLLILVAWTVSMVWRGEYWRRTDNTRGLLFQLDVGTFGVYRVINITYDAKFVFTRHAQGLPRPVWWMKPLHMHSRIGFICVVVPLWLPFLLIAVLTALLWWRDRRRIPRGHCQNCSYNLKGNVSGVCPECGGKVEAG